MSGYRHADLGAFIISNTSCSLQSHISTSIKAVIKYPPEQLGYLEDQLLADILNGNAWICRGSRLYVHVKINLHIPAGNEQLGPHHLLQACAISLRDSEFWSQLQLVTEITGVRSTRHPSSITGCVTLSVNHDRIETRKRAVVSHKLPRGEHYSDVQPPDGVPAYGLEEVLVQINIAPSSNNEIAAGDALSRPTMLLDDLESGFVEKDIVELVCSGFLLVITDSPKKLPRHIRVHDDYDYEERHVDRITLAKAVPSLWTPQYLEGISERSVFLPTICNSLAEVCGASTSDRFRQIKEIDPTNESQTHRSSSNSGQTASVAEEYQALDLEQKFSINLWRILQKSSYTKSRLSKKLGGSDLQHFDFRGDGGQPYRAFQDELETYRQFAEEQEMLDMNLLGKHLQESEHDMLEDCNSDMSISESLLSDLEIPSTQNTQPTQEQSSYSEVTDEDNDSLLSFRPNQHNQYSPCMDEERYRLPIAIDADICPPAQDSYTTNALGRQFFDIEKVEDDLDILGSEDGKFLDELVM